MKRIRYYVKTCSLYLKQIKSFLFKKGRWIPLSFVLMFIILSGTAYTDPEKFSLEFDGSDMKVEDSDADSYINGLDEITVSMWVKSNETNTDKGFVDGESPNSTDNKLIMRYDRDGWWNTVDRSNTIKIGLTIDGTEVNANASSDTQTTDWQHVVMTWSSGNEMKLYIDGVRDTDLKIASANPDGLSPSGVITDVNTLILGKGSKDDTSSWNGKIDDFYLFGRELTESEVGKLYNREKTLNSDSDLLTYYPMDEGSGTNLQDLSGNNHHATINGAQWQANEYILSFDSAGGSSVDAISQEYNTAITAPENPTREGYTFTGWDTDLPETMPAGDQTYTAQWKINQYTLNFDSTGGSTVNSITQDYDTSVTAPENPTREGYTFTGWDTPIPENMPAGDQTYTAQWDANEYTLSFDSSGGSTVRAC